MAGSVERVVRPATRLRGELSLPGDKSISHRAVLLNALAPGRARVTGFLRAEDTLRSLEAVRLLGVQVTEEGSVLDISSPGRPAWRMPPSGIDCGNSGTTARLLMGMLAGWAGEASLDGDASLRVRPMARVAEPLEAMGARVSYTGALGRLPLRVAGRATLRAMEHDLPVASAQLKSALLLAGLAADGPVRVSEPQASRDHTERLLERMGAHLSREGTACTVWPAGHGFHACDVDVPGDSSAAAFWAVAAACHADAEVVLESVGVNPTRTGWLDALQRMGAPIQVRAQPDVGGEPRARLTVAGGAVLEPLQVHAFEVPRLIDEVPILAVAASQARGRSRFEGLGELRVKESDRLGELAAGLAALGAEVAEGPDWLEVCGPARLRGGSVASRGDHRLAMAYAIAGVIGDGPVRVDDTACVAVSYPRFWEDLETLTNKHAI